MSDPPYVVPSREDPVVAVAATSIGGPVGRHAAIGARGLAGVASALVALAGVAMALGVWQKGHCLLKGWSNPDQFWRACYSDVSVVTVTSPLAQGQLPWTGATPSDQPLLSGLMLWLLSLLSPRSGSGTSAAQASFLLWAVVAMLLLAGAVLAAVALRPDRPWQAGHLAASPVLIVLALVSVDLLGVALVMAALWSWRRGRTVLAGVLLGQGFLVSPFALVFTLAVLLVTLRQRRHHEAARLAVAAPLSALALALPFLVLLPPAVLTAPRAWLDQGAGYGALALVPQLVARPLLPATSTALALAGWVAAALLGWWLSRRPGRAPGVVTLAAPMLLVVALTAKELPVQSGLWLLPLLALSTVSWRDHLLWAALEVLHFVGVWLHIAFGTDPGRGLPPDAYAVLVLLRLAGWTWLVWAAWVAGRAEAQSWSSSASSSSSSRGARLVT